jgi:secreted trypsin-like serine protease
MTTTTMTTTTTGRTTTARTSSGAGLVALSNDAGTCYGDSGGPQFLDGVQVSLTVTGDILCKSTNVVQRLDTELAQQFLQQYI